MGILGAGPPGRRRAEEGLLLESHVLKSVSTHHTGTDRTSVLYVPGLGLVVAGDAVYDNVHLCLLRALDTVEGPHPVAVVAGHRDRCRPDTPDTIAQTPACLDDVESPLALHPARTAFYQEVPVRHPGRLNPSPLWYGAQTLLS
ncbi:hypothetical protein [Streptomyces sp. bgisy034]|uniref:hypothetical protein n=1 Tax=Streptomyces sp. bgisy034 TaxID=3413774 RepID=UPI003EBEB7B1